MNSPCIDLGDPCGDYSDESDINTDDRVIFDRVDIGADEFSNPICGPSPADFNNDEIVDLLDFARMATAWLTDTNDQNWDPCCDLNSSDEIEINDLAYVAGDWLLTGDTGRREEDGYFRFVGREDDVITSGGYRIGPGEIEDCLLRHPAVAMAAVVGIPDDQWGERPYAFVVADNGVDTTELVDELLSRCRRELAGYKQPQSIEVLPELPLTAAGKVLRRALREPFWSGRSTQV